MPRSLVLLALALLLVVPGRSAAAGCKAPQGTSAVDQYCETIPDEKGDQGTGPGQDGGSPISDRTAGALVARGKDGEALVRALGKDPTQVKPVKRGKELEDAKGVSRPDAPSSNPFTAVTRAVSGTSTIGSTFFLALFAVVLLTLGSAWVGWRRNAS